MTASEEYLEKSTTRYEAPENICRKGWLLRVETSLDDDLRV